MKSLRMYNPQRRYDNQVSFHKHLSKKSWRLPREAGECPVKLGPDADWGQTFETGMPPEFGSTSSAGIPGMDATLIGANHRIHQNPD
jgi:hypothetical protein